MRRFGMAVIGLGVVGQRMLEQTARHAGIQVVSAWDAAPAARSAAVRAFPDLPVAASAADAIERLDVDVVYVATPPTSHAALVQAAIAAGKAVFCEKPLGVDLPTSVALVEAVEARRALEAVNFPFASSAAVEQLRSVLNAPGFDLRAIEIRVRFHAWPRDWQASARWLAQAQEGGFTREVLSHFFWLLHRLRGRVEVRGGLVTRPSRPPEAAEQAVAAVLNAQGVPVSLSGSVGGAAPDRIEARFIGEHEEWVLSDWYRLQVFDAQSPQGRSIPGLPEDPRQATYQRQLDQLHALLSGQAHTLPTFAEALAVQREVETLLRFQQDATR